jgi:hypothetical protein
VTLRSVAGPFLCVLRVLRVDLLFLIGILHTEIAKVAKTNRPIWSWMTLRSVCGPFLCVLCDLRVDLLWLQGTGMRTMEIMRQLLHGEILELPWVTTQRAEIDGNRANWRKLHVGNRVLVRCFFPEERTSAPRLAKEPRQLRTVNSQAPCERRGPIGLPPQLSA